MPRKRGPSLRLARLSSLSNSLTPRIQGGVLGVHMAKRAQLSHEGFLVTRTSETGAVPCARTCWFPEPIGTAPAGEVVVGRRDRDGSAGRKCGVGR